MSYDVIETRDSTVRRRWLTARVTSSARVALTCRDIFAYLHDILLFNREEHVHDHMSTLDSHSFSWPINSLFWNTVFHLFSAVHILTGTFFTLHSSIILPTVRWILQTVQLFDTSFTWKKVVIYIQTHFKHTERGCNNYLMTLSIANIIHGVSVQICQTYRGRSLC